MNQNWKSMKKEYKIKHIRDNLYTSLNDIPSVKHLLT